MRVVLFVLVVVAGAYFFVFAMFCVGHYIEEGNEEMPCVAFQWWVGFHATALFAFALFCCVAISYILRYVSKKLWAWAKALDKALD